jgi:hypothetical protein
MSGLYYTRYLFCFTIVRNPFLATVLYCYSGTMQINKLLFRMRYWEQRARVRVGSVKSIKEEESLD